MQVAGGKEIDRSRKSTEYCVQRRRITCWATAVQWVEGSSLGSFGWREEGSEGHSSKCGAGGKHPGSRGDPRFLLCNRASWEPRTGPWNEATAFSVSHPGAVWWSLFGSLSVDWFLLLQLVGPFMCSFHGILEESLNFLGEESGHTGPSRLASSVSCP